MSADRESRETSVSELLDYKISVAEDGTLQWDPPAGSQELALALSYHYPVESDVAGKMRAAVKTFLRARRRAESGGRLSGEHPSVKSRPKGGGLEGIKEANGVERNGNGNARSQSSKTEESHHDSKKAVNKDAAGVTAKGELEVLIWDPKLKGVKRQGRKRPYEKVEGAKVAANRGYVCDEHRRQKMKCDPDLCPRNGQRLKMTHSSETLNPVATFSHNSVDLLDSTNETSKSLGRFVDIKPSSISPQASLYSTATGSEKNDHASAANNDHLSSSTQPLTNSSSLPGNDALGTSAAVTHAPPNHADSLSSSSSEQFLPSNELGQGLSPVAFNTNIAGDPDFSALFNVDPLLFSYDIGLDSSDLFGDDWAAFDPNVSLGLNSPKNMDATAVIERERKPYTGTPGASKLPTVPEISAVNRGESGKSSPNHSDRLSVPDLAYHERLDFLLGNTTQINPACNSSSAENTAGKDPPFKGPRRGSSPGNAGSKYSGDPTSTSSSFKTPARTRSYFSPGFSTTYFVPPPPPLSNARGANQRYRYGPLSRRDTEGGSTSNSASNSPKDAEKWDRYRVDRSRRETEGGSTSNSEFNSPRDAERWDRCPENQSDRSKRSYERESVSRNSGYGTDENWYRARGGRESRIGSGPSSIDDLGDRFGRIEL